MPRVNECYLFDIKNKEYSFGCGTWVKLNELKDGYSKGWIEYTMAHPLSNPDWKLIKIGNNGEVIFLR